MFEGHFAAYAAYVAYDTCEMFGVSSISKDETALLPRQEMKIRHGDGVLWCYGTVVSRMVTGNDMRNAGCAVHVFCSQAKAVIRRGGSTRSSVSDQNPNEGQRCRCRKLKSTSSKAALLPLLNDNDGLFVVVSPLRIHGMCVL